MTDWCPGGNGPGDKLISRALFRVTRPFGKKVLVRHARATCPVCRRTVALAAGKLHEHRRFITQDNPVFIRSTR